MRDPKPENITGAKRFSHNVNWEINIAHTILGLLALFVAWKFFGRASSSSDDGQDESEIVPEGRAAVSFDVE